MQRRQHQGKKEKMTDYERMIADIYEEIRPDEIKEEKLFCSINRENKNCTFE